MSRKSARIPAERHLQAAFGLERKPHWPATQADAMRQPLLRAIVWGRALRLAIAETRQARADVHAHRAGPMRAPSPNPGAARAVVALPFDRKRAAAGDRDD